MRGNPPTARPHGAFGAVRSRVLSFTVPIWLTPATSTNSATPVVNRGVDGAYTGLPARADHTIRCVHVTGLGRSSSFRATGTCRCLSASKPTTGWPRPTAWAVHRGGCPDRGVADRNSPVPQDCRPLAGSGQPLPIGLTCWPATGDTAWPLGNSRQARQDGQWRR